MECKWRIFLANLNPVIGSEEGKTRPVLVISEEEINQILPVVNVLPITSRKSGRRIYPNEFLTVQAGLTPLVPLSMLQHREGDKMTTRQLGVMLV